MPKTLIRLRTNCGKGYDVQGEESKDGLLAVHPSIGGEVGWAVTHTPTGWAVLQGLTYVQATKLMDEIDGWPEWETLGKKEDVTDGLRIKFAQAKKNAGIQ